MKAEVLAIGSELLGPLRTETNSLWLTERLLDAGIEVVTRATLADDLSLLESAFRGALSRADVVIATGGLGPTKDDLTREAAAAALGRPLNRDEHILEALRKRFARLGRTMVKTNEQQADVIADAVVLPNPNGTAPGQKIEHEGRLLVLLPGPPGEMRPLFETQVLPLLGERTHGAVLRTRVLRIAGMPEGEIDQMVAPIYTAETNPRTTILSAPGDISLHLTATAATAEEAEARIEALATRMRQALPGLI